MITHQKSTFGDGSVIGIHDNSAHAVIRISAQSGVASLPMTPAEMVQFAAALREHASQLITAVERTKP